MSNVYIDPITTESLKIKFEDSVKSKLQAKYTKTRYELILPFASMLIQSSWNETHRNLLSLADGFSLDHKLSVTDKIRFLNEQTELSADSLFEEIVEEQEEMQRIFA